MAIAATSAIAILEYNAVIMLPFLIYVLYNLFTFRLPEEQMPFRVFPPPRGKRSSSDEPAQI